MTATATPEFDSPYQTHLKHLKLKGLQPKTIDATPARSAGSATTSTFRSRRLPRRICATGQKLNHWLSDLCA